MYNTTTPGDLNPNHTGNCKRVAEVIFLFYRWPTNSIISYLTYIKKKPITLSVLLKVTTSA